MQKALKPIFKSIMPRHWVNKCFLRESAAAAADVLCAKAQCQRSVSNTMFFARKRSGSGNNILILVIQYCNPDTLVVLQFKCIYRTITNKFR
ncbi:hypothetical protein [Lysinibacillus sp. RS5]|uniref:hypothetical protein n=1 Tax=unclassified Lysinibacillus TaxID=2636778 RepID=UPI0035BE6AA5